MRCRLRTAEPAFPRQALANRFGGWASILSIQSLLGGSGDLVSR